MKLNPLTWFRQSMNGSALPGPRITFARSTVGRTISRAGLLVRKQLWIWPIVAVLVLSAIGWFVRRAIESTMEESLRGQVASMLDNQAALLQAWINERKSDAESMASDTEIRQFICDLVKEKTPADKADDKHVGEQRANLERALGPAFSAHDYAGYVITDKKHQVVAASREELIGQKDAPIEPILAKALKGNTALSQPFPSIVAMEDVDGRIRTGVPTMFVCAPVRDDRLQIVAALALRIRPEAEFDSILELGRFGESGETYLFDRDGRMVSNSRFDRNLKLLGLIPDEEGAHSILNLLVRDPGGDMTAGFRPTQLRHELPLTYLASEAIAGRPGVNVAGYRDYRGAPVVGAWKWIPDADIGIGTEIEYAEAFEPLTILRRTFWGLFALLVLSAAAIFVFTVMNARLRRQAQKAAIEAQQIGQYTLERKLGAGGMGVVYKGHHAMLRRETAIKMLHIEKVNEASIQRFEHEVQITSQLNNPNTVAIYDYGRTPEGVFYYAMEYLDGIDLQTLVEQYGPQPVPRTIHILLQICSSLNEAHSLGLVHRDIKPSNIMLNRRGGEPDVVKVLDFGLVKALDDHKQTAMTDERALTGTPLYMSPEAIQLPSSVDGRSDLYAVGGVGYFLLTGKPVFEADNIVDLLQKQVAAVPEPPSQRVNGSIPPELDAALLACLEKSRAKRPQTPRELAQRLSRCKETMQWLIEDADAWWGRHERGQMPEPASHVRSKSDASTPAARQDMTIDLGH